MSFVDNATQELNVKIVYFGPNSIEPVEYIYGKTNPATRSEMTRLGENEDHERIEFFNFMPRSKAEGKRTPRFHLYCAHGQLIGPTHWATLLKGADAIVFVASSDRETYSVEDHEDMWNELETALAANGTSRERLPIVVQLDHEEHIDDRTSVDEIREALALPTTTPIIENTVTDDTQSGALDVLRAVTSAAIGALRSS